MNNMPALLYSMYVPLYVSYFIYIFVMNTATCLIAWYSFGRIAKKGVSHLSPASYTACPCTD